MKAVTSVHEVSRIEFKGTTLTRIEKKQEKSFFEKQA